MRIQPSIQLLACTVAVWPIWRWLLFERWMLDQSERLGLACVGILALVAFLFRKRNHPVAGWWPACFLVVYAVTRWLDIPTVIQAGFAMCAIAACLSQRWFNRLIHPGVFGLCVLVLPILASVDFYLGYPIRCVIAELSALCLNLGGVLATRSGTTVELANGLIAVDPKCSGIQMLWTGSVWTSILLVIHPWRRRMLLLPAISGALLMLANVARATTLIVLEPQDISDRMHSNIGLFFFGLALLGIYLLSQRLAGKNPTKSTQENLPLNGRKKTSSATQWQGFPRLRLAHGGWTRGIFIALACLVGLLPAMEVAPKVAREGSVVTDVPFPDTWEGEPLHELSLTKQEAVFAKGFPGRIKRFRAGNKEVVLRWVLQPTRRLHPARHCLAANGHTVRITPQWIDPDGRRWSTCTVEKLEVRELIIDQHGNHWPDISAWFWDVSWNQPAPGPWMHVTVSQARDLK